MTHALRPAASRQRAGAGDRAILWPQFRTLEASVSPLPLALAHGLTAYLDHYPYSCTEQLVSQAMPRIVLAHRPEFGYAAQSRQGATPRHADR